MTTYSPPTQDVEFILKHVLRMGERTDPANYAVIDEDIIDAVIHEAGRFCRDIVAPLNPASDRGCTRHPDGSVTTPEGFPAAYRAWTESGWGTLSQPEQWGGQGMPHALFTVIEEYLNSSCAGFMMYPGILSGAVATVDAAGTDELKAAYLPKMVSGQWLATMALTEGHAGTDLGLMKTAAARNGDGSYALSGEKIFISGGDHDLTDNIVHLVLARVPEAPVGTRGISLFLVPKVLPDGSRNGVSVGSIEHKMGLHGSATCVLNFDGATGWLLGDENAGLAAMFIMMNAARLAVGVQGLAHAEHAYQRAAAYALERKQGRAMGQRSNPAAAADPLIVHPDVRRMLMDARAFAEGFRALVLWTAVQLDVAHGAADPAERQRAEALVSFLTPVIKAFGSDRGFECAVNMQQVLGGHGYVSEWGVEQIVRDARIAMIYEGTNGVQALDLAGRKTAKDGGKVALGFLHMIAGECDAAPTDLAFIADPLGKAVHHGEAAVKSLLEQAGANPDDMAGAAYAYMQLIGTLAIGWSWLKLATVAHGQLAAGEGDKAFLEAKLITARFYAEQQLPLCTALRHRVKAGAGAMMGLSAEQFLRG
ncbi:acyl-CoA dehydrogenase C-terminal domain-containing protein [Altererythrobacter sp. KTW20L]|uniref:acyl-CoA dehydrogenase C-terminal domain-containing protein n=1 Tax=Altererythrobacter sp. KTW20L TaxID=2942210 RepID=UPI0020BF7C19|nr:acyl-CoA dehydrogenase C-terminal domain-containing protein [Altererythrobacter sp. KTW20L]MCL6251018.1 acyl-CoA dehydrogenase C-terminal domain-containing protein [Altererythrobacter sp. KTW20L]